MSKTSPKMPETGLNMFNTGPKMFTNSKPSPALILSQYLIDSIINRKPSNTAIKSNKNKTNNSNQIKITKTQSIS